MASMSLHPQSTKPNLVSSPNKSHNFRHPNHLPTPNLLIRPSPSPLRCKCSRSSSDNQGGGGGGDEKRLDEWIHDMVKSAVKRWDDYVNSYWGSTKSEPESMELSNSANAGDLAGAEEKPEEKNKGEWDWERWKRHFHEMEEQEMIVSMLKVQLRDSVAREDYADAAKLKLTIDATEKNDAVGSALSYLSRAIEEERYKDAIFLRDHAGVGLVGWWAGVSQDSTDPYGRIIQIRPEHGKYVARSYSSRQLSSARPGIPLFEIYFSSRDGEYKQQAVYLKRVSRKPRRSPKIIIKGSDADSLIEEQNDIYSDDIKTNGEDRDDDSDGLEGIQNVLRDMMPGVKVKVMKVVAPGKVDRDLISKVIDQIIDEEEEGEEEEDEEEEKEDSTDDELDGLDTEDVKLENNIQIDEIKSENLNLIGHAMGKQNEIPMKFVIGTLIQKMSTNLPPKDVVRVPAKLERDNRLSFLFTIEQDVKQKENNAKGKVMQKRAAALSAQQSYKTMFDLSKSFLSKEAIPMNVLKDVGELLNLTMNQNQNHQSLFSPTLFHRIEIPSTADPLRGLYIGAHGMNASEILHLKRKFGQWKENDSSKNTDLEFYEYVEAYKLTGSVSVPAGQVAFRAKIGKQYQLPHKGIIPEEFGVIARYKGQGRIADPGFRNPRWVDGDLVILDGKLIREGPVIAFVYWAPEYHFLVFFNRLKLPQ